MNFREIPITQEPPVIDKDFIDSRYPRPSYAYLYAGDKVLALKILGPSPDLEDTRFDVSSRIDNVRVTERVDGATTALYTRVREILEELAGIYDTQINYKFTTKNERMRAWALDENKGRAVFDWDMQEEEQGWTTLRKVISPKS